MILIISVLLLAILRYFKDQLDDLEHSEILAFLRCLPDMDVDEVCF